MNRIIAIVIMTLSVFMFSCGTQKKATHTNAVNKDKTVIESENISFSTLSAKLNVGYKSKNDKLNASATIRIKQDSIIWMSITAAFGIEVLRIAITQDSVKMINKLSKEYIADDYNYIRKMIDIDVNYNMVQNLLIGDMISGSKDVFIQDVKYTMDDTKVSKIIIRSAKEPRMKLIADYDDFKDILGGTMPAKIQFNVPDRNIKINVEYSKILTDKPQEYPLSIPSSYTKMKS